jgi:hypothetical protein
MTANYQPGEHVNVTITAARVTKASDQMIIVELDDHHEFPIPIAVGSDVGSGVTITRVTPAEWPPMFGDLWCDGEGELWLARYVGLSEFEMAAANIRDHRPMRPKQLLADRGPLTLAYRKPRPPYCVACEADGHTDDDRHCAACRCYADGHKAWCPKSGEANGGQE